MRKIKVAAAIFAIVATLQFSGCKVFPNAASKTMNAGVSTSDDTGSEASGNSGNGSHGIDEPYAENPDHVPADINVSLNADGNTLMWNAPGAYIFEVLLGNEVICVTTENRYVVKNVQAGVYTATVRAYEAIGEISYAYAQTDIVIKAEAPSLTIDGNCLTWNAAEGAAKYVIYKDGAFFTQTLITSHIVSQTGIYTVFAVFDDERLNSDGSNPVAVGNVPLSAPELKLEEGNLAWKAVAGAERYVIVVEGKSYGAVIVYDSSEKEYFYDIAAVYEDKLKYEYPNGVTVEIYAWAFGLEQSKNSNKVFYSANA